VDPAREQFFPRAGLANQQHRCSARARNRLRKLNRFAEKGALADDVLEAEHAFGTCGCTSADVGDGQRNLGERVAD
jgi:hypothetical protein